MGMYLKGLPGETTLVGSGQECLDHVAQDSPHLVLMDCQMPDMDGFETVTRLRASGYGGKVLALTANSDEATLERCRACGMDGHISKPVTAAVLQERVLSALSAASPSTAGPEAGGPPPEPAAGQEASHDFSGDNDPLARLRALTMGGRNAAIFNRLLAAFIKSVDESIEQMKTGLSSDEADSVAAAAHRVRGSAGSFGAGAFSEQAGAVEDSLATGELVQGKSLAQDLVKSWGPLRSYLENAGGNT